MADAVSQTDDRTTSGHTAMQHDLEKLQEAHDKLLQELEDKKNFTEKLHTQLDSLIERNDSLNEQLQEKEQDLEKAIQLLRQNESLAAKVQESESKSAKLKQLAVKLKKELAETKEELDRRSQNESLEAKDQLKQLLKESERLTSLYQSSARNFQNLQSDFDKLQDDYETSQERCKKLDQDLTQAITELTKLRIEVEELKHEKENRNKKIAELDRDSESQFVRRKELEGKIIVLSNELEQEKKKLAHQAGLERIVNELRCQLDLKTTEVVELGELVERHTEVQEELQQLKILLKGVQEEMKTLREENEEEKEKSWNLSRKLEAINASHEQERVRIVELLEETKHSKSLESQLKEVHSKNIAELESRIRFLMEQLKSTQATLSFTEQEFEAYKVKVTRVLNEKTNTADEISSLKQTIGNLQSSVQALQADKDLLDSNLLQEKRAKVALTSDFNSRIASLLSDGEAKQQQIDSLKKENDGFRTLSRELQCQLVSQRNQHEQSVKQLKLDMQSRESQLQKELEEEKRLLEFNGRSSDLPSESTPIPTDTCQGPPSVKALSQRSGDDVDSLANTSLATRTKRFSMTSSIEFGQGLVSGQDSILDDILNYKSDDEDVFQASLMRRNDSIERLQEMLQESESGGLLLTEQNRVLKEEIRRLERALARIEVAQNLEYLKNLLVKFMSLEPGSSEKLQLVPVLKEILKLDSNEENVLLVTAASDVEGKANQSNGSWSFLWG